MIAISRWFLKSAVARTATLTLACSGFTFVALAEEDLAKRASWQQPTAAEVKIQLDEWLAGRQVEDATRAKIDAMWTADQGPPTANEMLDQFAATVVLVEDRAGPLLEACHRPLDELTPPSFEILDDENTPAVIRQNLRLMFARWLAQQGLYDEALSQISSLKPEDVVDPATLLFLQGVTYHWLMDKDKCLPVIARLLERREAIPRRYETMAELMQADLQPLKTDSLDEISRLMGDIRRRLELARAGTKVRKQEDDVIAKLDKMIEELEKQRQQQQQQQGGGGNNPSQPMPDSMPGGGSGPGNVDPKRLADGRGWGNLPPKQRQEALQQIGKDFPSHYREVIEEYFRKLARDAAKE